FTYTQCGWRLDGDRLVLTGIGSIKVKMHRPIGGAIKTVTLKRACAKWYVTFTCEIEPVPLPAAGESVGIDLGLIDFLMTDTGEPVPTPQYFRRGEAVLARRQRALARKKRGSKSRHKAKLLVAKAHRHV